MAIPPLPAPDCPYPHLGDGPWPCCQIYAENFPSNTDEQLGEPEKPLPGWTVQQGNAHVEPMVVCPFCDQEYRAGDIHLHTRVTHGYELAVTPENRKPHPYGKDPIHYER